MFFAITYQTQLAEPHVRRNHGSALNVQAPAAPCTIRPPHGTNKGAWGCFGTRLILLTGTIRRSTTSSVATNAKQGRNTQWSNCSYPASLYCSTLGIFLFKDPYGAFLLCKDEHTLKRLSEADQHVWGHCMHINRGHMMRWPCVRDACGECSRQSGGRDSPTAACWSLHVPCNGHTVATQQRQV